MPLSSNSLPPSFPVPSSHPPQRHHHALPYRPAGGVEETPVVPLRHHHHPVISTGINTTAPSQRPMPAPAPPRPKGRPPNSGFGHPGYRIPGGNSNSHLGHATPPLGGPAASAAPPPLPLRRFSPPLQAHVAPPTASGLGPPRGSAPVTTGAAVTPKMPPLLPPPLLPPSGGALGGRGGAVVTTSSAREGDGQVRGGSGGVLTGGSLEVTPRANITSTTGINLNPALLTLLHQFAASSPPAAAAPSGPDIGSIDPTQQPASAVLHQQQQELAALGLALAQSGNAEGAAAVAAALHILMQRTAAAAGAGTAGGSPRGAGAPAPLSAPAPAAVFSTVSITPSASEPLPGWSGVFPSLPPGGEVRVSVKAEDATHEVVGSLTPKMETGPLLSSLAPAGNQESGMSPEMAIV